MKYLDYSKSKKQLSINEWFRKHGWKISLAISSMSFGIALSSLLINILL